MRGLLPTAISEMLQVSANLNVGDYGSVVSNLTLWKVISLYLP